jgi:hypothetical protein
MRRFPQTFLHNQSNIIAMWNSAKQVGVHKNVVLSSEHESLKFENIYPCIVIVFSKRSIDGSLINFGAMHFNDRSSDEIFKKMLRDNCVTKKGENLSVTVLTNPEFQASVGTPEYRDIQKDAASAREIANTTLSDFLREHTISDKVIMQDEVGPNFMVGSDLKVTMKPNPLTVKILQSLNKIFSPDLI